MPLERILQTLENLGCFAQIPVQQMVVLHSLLST